MSSSPRTPLSQTFLGAILVAVLSGVLIWWITASTTAPQTPGGTPHAAVSDVRQGPSQTPAFTPESPQGPRVSAEATTPPQQVAADEFTVRPGNAVHRLANGRLLAGGHRTQSLDGRARGTPSRRGVGTGHAHAVSEVRHSPDAHCARIG
jgi:hypothetical protein